MVIRRRQPTDNKNRIESKEMSLNVKMSARMVKGLEEMFQQNTVETVKLLGGKYEFNVEEALLFLNITEEVKVEVKVKGVKEGKEKEVKEPKEKKVKEKKEKKEGPKMVLPFCGRVVTEWCEGVKLNHGLYSQCVSEKGVSEEKYCKSCKKQAEANESSKPTLGDINERMLKSSAEYRAEKGKKCVVYAVVMKKLKITKEDAEAEALKFGLEIPAEEFEMPKSQRGRPKKVSESDSVSSGSTEGEKKGRGRPKKNKTVAENQTDETDDLIASLVAEANALKGAGAGASASASEADDEEEETETVKKNVLKEIAEKIKADETFNTLYSQVVPKEERKAHLNAIDEHLKTLLTAEEMALYQSASTDEEEAEAEASEAEASEAEEEVEEEAEEEAEEEEEEEDEATKKAREAAEKKAQAELEKQQKKEQADLEKKAKADLKKQAKAEADAEKKVKADLEKKAKKEQADLEKKAKKEQADLEKQAKKPAEKKVAEKKVAEKKVAQAEVKPVEKAASAELQVEVVEESNAATETVNAEVFEFEGKKYLKTNEGILYDQETEESIGVWNEETKSIDEFADDEE